MPSLTKKTMSKRTFTFCLALLSILLLTNCQDATNCRDEIGCVVIPPDQPIRLGYMLVTSGENQLLGVDSLGGIEIAIGDRGEIFDRPIELVGLDSKCSPEGGAEAAQAMVGRANIVAIIGTTCSSAASTALPIISEAGLLMISPSTTGPSLTDPEQAWHPGFFRTAHNDLFQGRLAAEFAAIQLGARTAATIHDGSNYAEELTWVFADVFTEIGGEIVMQHSIEEGSTDMQTALEAIAEQEPQILYFPVFEPEGSLIAQQAMAIEGLQNTVFVGSDGLLTTTFAPDTGSPAVGMYLSGPYVNNAANNNLMRKWMDTYGEPPPSNFHAFAYDATNLLLTVIQNTAQITPDGTLVIGRQALRDALTNTADFQGITGNITCSEHGDCATGEALAIYRVSDEQINGDLFPPPVEWTK